MELFLPVVPFFLFLVCVLSVPSSQNACKGIAHDFCIKSARNMCCLNLASPEHIADGPCIVLSLTWPLLVENVVIAMTEQLAKGTDVSEVDAWLDWLCL